MKRMIVCVPVLFMMLLSNAQSKNTSSKKKPSSTATVSSKKNNQKTGAKNNTVTLTSASVYPAKTNTSQTPSFTITDPIPQVLDARAAGADIKINRSGIVGMSKKAFGIANGKIFLGTTGSVTSGTQTGSGSVGTGTGLGTFGSSSPVMGVNGKSPNAGSGMWGNATNLTGVRGDSTVRLNSIKQQ